MSAEVLEASFGSETIRFSVVRRVRKTLSISVLPDQQVEVVAPEDASSERIIEKVRKRAPWICKQLRYYDQFQPKTVNGGVKFGHCGGAKVGQFGASALERAALI